MAWGWRFRALALFGAALALGGCNLVVSEKPVFTAADTTGAPALRPGVWSGTQPGCDFKSSDPVAKWPKCAGGGVITATAIMASVETSTARPDDQSQAAANRPMTVPYLLAAGDPRVMQINVKPPAQAGGPPVLFFFAALKPVARDSDGRIIQAEVWPIQCGPPPPAKAASASDAADQGGITSDPLPGMKVSDGMCAPTDKAAVRNAATASRAWADSVGTIRWLRDGLK